MAVARCSVSMRVATSGERSSPDSHQAGWWISRASLSSFSRIDSSTCSAVSTRSRSSSPIVCWASSILLTLDSDQPSFAPSCRMDMPVAFRAARNSLASARALGEPLMRRSLILRSELGVASLPGNLGVSQGCHGVMAGIWRVVPCRRGAGTAQPVARGSALEVGQGLADPLHLRFEFRQLRLLLFPGLGDRRVDPLGDLLVQFSCGPGDGGGRDLQSLDGALARVDPFGLPLALGGPGDGQGQLDRAGLAGAALGALLLRGFRGGGGSRLFLGGRGRRRGFGRSGLLGGCLLGGCLFGARLFSARLFFGQL